MKRSLSRTPLRDGYDLNGSVTLEGKEYRLLYRPMLRHDIRSIAQEARWVSEQTGREVIRSAVLDQLLVCDASLEALIHEDHPDAIPSLWRLVTAFLSPQWERESAQNLYSGQMLRLLHPQVATRKCSDCKVWWYNHQTGKIQTRDGEFLRRPIDQVLPCQIGECAKGSPDGRLEWTEQNRLAAEHFVRCDAVGQFPNDPIVRRNAAILRKAMNDAMRLVNRARVGSGQTAR